MSVAHSQERYRRFTYYFLVYTLAVIVWGTFVRASLSGDGCGEHWPLCNGEVLPVDVAVKTWIELTHRVTSGLAWIGSFIVLLWSRRAWSAGHPTRRFAAWSFFFMCAESLVGAALVLLRLVADNPDFARAYWMGAHLLNTFLLLAAMSFTALTASGRAAPHLRRHPFGALLGLSALALLVVGMTGAVTALGDTVFRPADHVAVEQPVDSARDGFAALFGRPAVEGAPASATHLFVRLRVFHPLLALAVAAWILFVGGSVLGRSSDRGVRQLAMTLVMLVLLQIGLGFMNVALLAPVWLQLVHLLVADGIWIALMALISFSSRAQSEQPLGTPAPA